MLSKELIKRIRSLHKKKFRDEQQLFIIEGGKIINEALQFNPKCILTIYSTSPENYSNPDFETVQVTQSDLKKISTLNQPQGDLAICRYLEGYLTSQTKLKIALDKIQDPGNLGTIIRLAAWFGVEEIIASPDTVDCYNPKVIQATMGAIFNVNITYRDLKSYLEESHLPIYGALLEGENVYRSKLQKDGVLIMGNEGNGISDELIPLISHPITIPKFGTGESLNVAMATGILLSEFYRD
ncbi:MAG: RNA methyltransferase [Brumimicrobium sp.]